MRVLVRNLLRLLALLLLLALLAGIPIALIVIIRVPAPSFDRWRDVWRTHRIDTDLVITVGAAVSLVLWTWFAITAVAEFVRVLPHRHDATSVPVGRRRGRGPGAAVCGLVRFVAISSLGAGLVTGGLAGASHAAGKPAITHVVERGDSYWEIAEGHLDRTLGRRPTNGEVMALTEQLVTRNAPLLGHADPTLLVGGEIVVVVPADDPTPQAARVMAPEVPVAAAVQVTPTNASATTSALPPTRVVRASTVSPRRESALPGFAGALLLAGGALITLESRRRRQLRSAEPAATATTPSFAQARTELLLRSLSPAECLARLDVGLRAAARDVAAQGAVIVAATIDDAGGITLHLRGSALPTASQWRADITRGVWFLSGATSMEELADQARDCVAPCPALVHLGTLTDGPALFVDLEAFGAVSVSSSMGASLARAVVSSLAVSPFRSGGSLRSVGVDGLPPSSRLQLESTAGVDAVVALAAARADAALATAWSAGTSTFALRVGADGGESWEPSVLVIGADSEVVPSMADVPCGAGLAVLVVGDVAAPARLIDDGDHLIFEPLGARFRPATVDAADLREVAELLDASSAWVEPIGVRPVDESRTTGSFREPEWDLLVHTIGQVFVESASGSIAEFERSKSLELVVWMALHRERSTRSGARSALWEVGVRSATFANVVSEARRALGALVSPVEGEDWVGRTLTDDLPLHPRVVTDGDLLQARLDAARGLAPQAAIAVLRPGVELVTGLPFSSPCFAWVDGEGHTSSLVLLATSAAVELAQHHLALGDIEGVFWATGQGLRVLPGHEALIALRMRAHASRGDLAGVRLEYEQYERALAADTWSPGEPSPKLVALRRELVGSPMAAPANGRPS